MSDWVLLAGAATLIVVWRPWSLPTRQRVLWTCLFALCLITYLAMKATPPQPTPREEKPPCHPYS
jgi:hypothetical protein